MYGNQSIEYIEGFVQRAYKLGLDPQPIMLKRFGLVARFIPGILKHVPEVERKNIIKVAGGFLVIQGWQQKKEEEEK